ncbi:MAG: LysR family transcriptional regulator [Pseudomonadota bacterium]
MEHWTELRTALMVARLGTVKAAAEELGVHRATVNRHVDLLESAFGVPLFQRHARGYSLTETGSDMLEIANRADEMFIDLAGRSRGREGRLSGTLVVTALAGVAPLVMPALRDFHIAHPQIALDFVAGAELARLEHGEAHVAFRAGAKPETPDYVVQPFRRIRFGLYANQSYVDRAGFPDREHLDGHDFIGSVGKPVPYPFADWMDANVPPSALALQTTDQLVVMSAISAGMGLGFLAEPDVSGQEGLVEVIPPSDAWSAAVWIVTHVDLHRTAKVQAFLSCIKALNG